MNSSCCLPSMWSRRLEHTDVCLAVFMASWCTLLTCWLTSVIWSRLATMRERGGEEKRQEKGTPFYIYKLPINRQRGQMLIDQQITKYLQIVMNCNCICNHNYDYHCNYNNNHANQNFGDSNCNIWPRWQLIGSLCICVYIEREWRASSFSCLFFSAPPPLSLIVASRDQLIH